MISDLRNIYPDLYGKEYNENEMDKRFTALIEKHKELFGTSDAALFSAAGRTEISRTRSPQAVRSGASHRGRSFLSPRREQ